MNITSDWILWILFYAVVVIAWFLIKRNVKNQSDLNEEFRTSLDNIKETIMGLTFQNSMNKDLKESVEKLNESVNALNISVTQLKFIIEEREKDYNDFNKNIHLVIDTHEKKLSKIEKDILLIEAKFINK